MRYLIETRNANGRTLVASVETGPDAALHTLHEHLHCAGFPIVPTAEYGHPGDAVFSIGPVGSEPEVWSHDGGSSVVLQAVM